MKPSYRLVPEDDGYLVLKDGRYLGFVWKGVDDRWRGSSDDGKKSYATRKAAANAIAEAAP